MKPFAIQIAGCKCSNFKADIDTVLASLKYKVIEGAGIYYVIYKDTKTVFVVDFIRMPIEILNGTNHREKIERLLIE
jgi:hypothetical protein